MARLTQWITVITGIVSSLFVSSCSRVSENERKYDPTAAEQTASENAAAAKEGDMSSNKDSDDSISIKDYPKDEEPQEIYGPPEMFGGPRDEPDDIQLYPPVPEPKPIYGPPEMLQPSLPVPPPVSDNQTRQIEDPDLIPEIQDDEPGSNEKMSNYKKLDNRQKKTIYGPPAGKKKVVLNSAARRGSNVDPNDEEQIDEHGNIVIPKPGPGEIRALYGVVPPSIKK